MKIDGAYFFKAEAHIIRPPYLTNPSYCPRCHNIY